MDAESFVSVVGTAADMIREVVFEERKIIEEAPRRIQEIPQQTVTDTDDDWFVLLDVFPRETTYVPAGIAKIPCNASEICQSKQLSWATFSYS